MNEDFMSKLDSGSGQTKGFFVNIMTRTLNAKKCTELEH